MEGERSIDSSSQGRDSVEDEHINANKLIQYMKDSSR